MPDYRRNRVPGGTYFFTVNQLDRRSSLLLDQIEDLRELVRRVRELMPFHIDAWVVLPEHMHALWTLPAGDADFSRRWQAIKMAFTKWVAIGEAVSASRRARGERGIWQRRYWEHTIRDEQDYAAHMDYIHFNPVWYRKRRRGHSLRFTGASQPGLHPRGWGSNDDRVGDLGERPPDFCAEFCRPGRPSLKWCSAGALHPTGWVRSGC